MFLRFNRRYKDGKEHRYWNIVENNRCSGGKVVQRQVLYLGEINDTQIEDWCNVIEAFDEGTQRHKQLALFPADRTVPEHAHAHGVQVRLDAMELHRPMGCVLVGLRTLRATRSQPLLGKPSAGFSRRNVLAGHLANIGVLSAD
jgi:hypothetical protein